MSLRVYKDKRCVPSELTPYPPYIAVLVVEIDDEPKWSPSHWLSRDEGVLKCGLPTGRNHSAQLKSCEVLDVELVILTKTERN